MNLSRLVLAVKDIMKIKGCSERTAQREMQFLRNFFNKAEHQSITIPEYANYEGIRIEDIKLQLKL